MYNTKITVDNSVINYEYKNNKYKLIAEGASFAEVDGAITADGECITLYPTIN